MEQRNKNILIGGLLAIVLVMAVGYAAFATQLNVQGTSKIDTTWNIHYDTSVTTVKSNTPGMTGAGALVVTNSDTSADAKNKSAAIEYSEDGLTAYLYNELQQQGDKIEYELTIVNDGSFDAKAGKPLLTLTGKSNPGESNEANLALVGEATDLTQQVGNIKYTVSQPADVDKKGGTSNTTKMLVTVEYVGDATTTGNIGAGTSTDGNETPLTGNMLNKQSASAKIALVYSQK